MAVGKYYEYRAPRSYPADGEKDVWFDNGRVNFGTFSQDSLGWAITAYIDSDGFHEGEGAWSEVGAYGSSEPIRYATDSWESVSSEPLSYRKVGSDYEFTGLYKTASGKTSTTSLLWIATSLMSKGVCLGGATATVEGIVANLDLQLAMAAQQNLLQTLSNLSKQIYDAGLSVIRKLG